ncbi:MAG: PQQ-binding-like beta-propeller repeat protein [Verrucomicrobiales bacterium]
MAPPDGRDPEGGRLPARARREGTTCAYCAACHGLTERQRRGAILPLVGIGERKTRAEIEQSPGRAAAACPATPRCRRQRAAILDYVLGTAPPPSANRAEPGAPDSAPKPGQQPEYAFGGFRRWLDADGYPAIKPPWGTLNAVDLNTGEIKWKVVLGEYPELTARGMPPTGTENYGVPLVTAGGVLFIGATADETFRAFDKETGKLLWKAELPFSGNATPSTYAINGRQFIAISAGGGKSGRKAGGSLVVFALPE